MLIFTIIMYLRMTEERWKRRSFTFACTFTVNCFKKPLHIKLISKIIGLE